MGDFIEVKMEKSSQNWMFWALIYKTMEQNPQACKTFERFLVLGLH